jgi:hypothetical protein
MISSNWDVQLRFIGEEGSAGPPAAGDPQKRGGVFRVMAKDFGDCTRRRNDVGAARAALCRAVLLQIFYSVRGERMLMEQMNYNLPFR